MGPFKKLSLICLPMMLIALVAGMLAESHVNVIFSQGFLAGIGLLWWICAVAFDVLHFDGESERPQSIGSGLFGGPPPN